MDVIARTCDRCARFAEDCTVIEDTYICGDCRAEIAADEAEVESLRQQARGAVELLDELYERLLYLHVSGNGARMAALGDTMKRVAALLDTTRGRS